MSRVYNFSAGPSMLPIDVLNKAAEEIRHRIEETLGMGKLRMSISTFHSFCARVLREECKAIGYPSNFSVIDEDGNRIDSIDITGGNNKKKIYKERTKLKATIKRGEYNAHANFSNGEQLRADIEVHDDSEYYLLWIE